MSESSLAKPAAARKALLVAASKKTDWPTTLVATGQVSLELGEIEEAEAHFVLAAAAHDDDPPRANAAAAVATTALSHARAHLDLQHLWQ